MRPENTFHSVGCDSAVCLSETRNGCSRLFSISHKGSTISLGYELTPCPCIAWELHAQCWFWSRGNQLCPLAFWLKYHWATLIPGVVACLSGQMDGKIISQAGRALIQLLVWVWANLVLGLAELHIWGLSSGRSVPCWVPGLECVPDLVL